MSSDAQLKTQDMGDVVEGWLCHEEIEKCEESDMMEKGRAATSPESTINSKIFPKSEVIRDGINDRNCGHCGLKMLVSDEITAPLQVRGTNRA